MLSRFSTLLRGVTLAVVAAGSLFARTPATPEQMNKLYADYWEELLVANPIIATIRGDNRFNDRFGFVTAAQAIADTKARAEKYLALTSELDPASLAGEDRISYDLFRYTLRESLEGLRFPSHLMPVNQIFSAHLYAAQLGSGQLAQPFKTVQDYDNWLKRAQGIAPFFDGQIADMREGMARGIVLPKKLAAATLPQLESLSTDNLTLNVFMLPVRKMPENFSAADKERLTAALTAIVREQIVPAYQRLHRFMRDEYLPACRDTYGMSALPGGAEWYAFNARSSTTTGLTPEQIHEIGLSEVARIRGEMEKVKEQVGFRGTLEEFFVHVDADPALKFKTAEEMQAAFEGLRASVEARVPEFFGRVPKSPFIIRAVEKFREASAAPGQYFGGTPDGSRPGIFYYSAYKPESRPRFSTEALFLHEALPGHHFEISLAQEQTGLPAFRRFGGTGAFSEGWGLYVEALGQEMGFYKDPYQWFGRLGFESWRAVRLVVDTGIHAKGWTREQAIAYFRANTPQAENVAIQEVERYIAAPGQALSYKIGELKIWELRRRAEKELGPKFNLRDFHDEVLAHGSVPLSVLEAAVNRWSAARR